MSECLEELDVTEGWDYPEEYYDDGENDFYLGDDEDYPRD